MNRYGTLAREHWTKYAPSKVAALEDPEQFFESLGEQVAERVTSLSVILENEHRPSPDFLDQVGLLNAIRKQAEEVALSDLVWLTPDQVEYDDVEAASEELWQLPDRLQIEQTIRDLQRNQNDPDDPDAGLSTIDYEERLADLQQTLARIKELEAKIPEGY